MLKVLATKCSCGAITVSEDEGAEHKFSNSMTQETFDKLFENDGNFVIEWMNECYCCNHCVNKWGLDICKCGSGDPVGECTWEDCEFKDGETMETFLNSAPSILEVFEGRGGF